MYQYFSDVPLAVGEDYRFTKEQAHHARDVVRLRSERVRLVYEGKGFFAETFAEGKDFFAHVTEEDPRVSEPGAEITLCAALIRREKMELILQKATELGAARIVLFESSRCVVHEKKEKGDRVKERRMTIVSEAASQCKRNRIPEVTDVIPFKELKNYTSDVSLAAYEDAYGTYRMLKEEVKPGKSVTCVIGPEGGFSEAEVEELKEMGYLPVTFGKRILRAETAALYACSVISELLETEE